LWRESHPPIRLLRCDPALTASLLVRRPGYTKTVAGAGLPDGSGGFGDLTIHFDIQFPSSLRPEQKMLLRTGLALPKKLTAPQQAALTSVKNAFA